jgi:hypothetical protein
MDETEKPKFPRFSRREDGRCRLTEEDLSELRSCLASGATRKEMAFRFGVTEAAIGYWTLTAEERARKNRLAHERRKASGKDEGNKAAAKASGYWKKYRERKKATHPELAEYETATEIIGKATRANWGESRKASEQKYYRKNRRERLDANASYRSVAVGRSEWAARAWLARRGIRVNCLKVAEYMAAHPSLAAEYELKKLGPRKKRAGPAL